MNTKVLVGGVIGGVVFFLLGFLIWGLALMSVMEKYSNMACMRPEEDFNMILMGISNILWGLAYAYIFSKANINSFSAGAVSGAIVAVLIGLSIDLAMYSYTTMSTSLTPAFINVAANGVLGAVGGGVIAWWLGRK